MSMSMAQEIEAQIKVTIENEVLRIKEELIQDTVKKFEKEVREVIGTVAVNVAKYYSVENLGLMLHVRIQTETSNG